MKKVSDADYYTEAALLQKITFLRMISNACVLEKPSLQSLQHSLSPLICTPKNQRNISIQVSEHSRLAGAEKRRKLSFNGDTAVRYSEKNYTKQHIPIKFSIP